MSMTMAMSSMSTATSTATDMAMSSTMSMDMATSTAMSSSDMSSTMMGMSDMMMVFFTSPNTPLYSSAWTPHTKAQYFGTCLFLIALSVVMRGLIALRANFSGLWGSWATSRSTDAFMKPEDLRRNCGTRRPWSVNEAGARALLDTILAGVSYLLMLAVMTMNLGYFLSVLGGVFLGSFVLAGFAGNAVAAH